jgi:hypothetical protein
LIASLIEKAIFGDATEIVFLDGNSRFFAVFAV